MSLSVSVSLAQSVTHFVCPPNIMLSFSLSSLSLSLSLSLFGQRPRKSYAFTHGEISPSSLTYSRPKSWPSSPYPSLEAQIPSLRTKSQPQGPSPSPCLMPNSQPQGPIPSLMAQFPASRHNSQFQGPNPSLKAQMPASRPKS